MMKTIVVIPNWNGAELIRPCLESLVTQTHKCDVVVVDNGSSDDSVPIIEAEFPDVRLIKNDKNLGFAGGVNVGIRHAMERGAEAVALFNNDAVADRDWLAKLVEVMRENDSAGIVTGKLLRHDKVHIDSTGDFYSIYGIPFPRGRNLVDGGQFDTPEEVFGASGGASLYRASMLQEIGLFDERFFAYYEDVDISFRARLAGWKIVYTPEAMAYHHLSATSSKLGDFTRFHSIKNFLLLYTKNMPAALYWKYLPVFLYQFARTTASSILSRKFIILLQAVFAFLGYLPSVLRDRRTIQKNRKVSAKDIDALLRKQRPPRIPQVLK